MKLQLFTGRRHYLDSLNRLLRKRTASLVVIRGRRRIGKSRLIEEFSKGKKCYSFSGLAPAEQTTAQAQRDEFARQIQENLDLPGLKANDWGDLFTLLAKQTAKGQVIILLDEITWMGSLDPTFLSKLKIAWDLHFKKNPKLILILCGSVSAWIEKNIISSTGFFGRISYKINLQELSLPNCNKLLNAVGFKGSLFEKFILLSITGGIPWYMELMNPSLSAVENIKRLCFTPDGILVDEFERIFNDLFGKRNQIYKRIVEALVNGPATYSEISKKINYPSGGPLSEYLEELIISGYISRDHSWSIKTGNPIDLFKYRLKDNYVRFYLKYISPNLSKIERNAFINESITNLPGFNSIIGFQFENLVLANRQLILEKLGIKSTDIIYDNPFFQRHTNKTPGCQIDYLIQTRFNTLYVCEIKFTRSAVNSSIVNEVRDKITRFKIPRGFSCLPVLIHVNGVVDTVTEQQYFTEIIDMTDFLEQT